MNAVMIIVGILIAVVLGAVLSPWVGGIVLVALGVAGLVVLVAGARTAASPETVEEHEPLSLPGPGDPDSTGGR